MNKIKTISRLILVLFSSWFLTFNINSQNNPDQGEDGGGDKIADQVIPPSPDAAALGKYGNIPVNLYTGSPTISIPLHQLGIGDIGVNLSLSYNTSGIKVDEISSWVGLGWTLNSGGVITRSVNGFPDEGVSSNVSSLYTTYGDIKKYLNGEPPNCVIDPNDFDENAYFPTKKEYYTFQKNIVTNQLIETQPDLYFYNFGGTSGKMFIDPTTGELEAHSTLHNGLIIKPIFENGNDLLSFTHGDRLISWEITDTNGTKYIFSDVEETSINNDVSLPAYSFYSSWYLTKIIAANKIETIEFVYDVINLNNQQLKVNRQESKTEPLPSNIGMGCESTYSNSVPNVNPSYTQKVLKEINVKSSDELITQAKFFTAEELDPNEIRRDLLEGGNILRRIEIYQKSIDNVILQKSYDFTQSYFGNVEDPNEVETELRLKLESVKETGHYKKQVTDSDISKPSYQFTYNENYDLPDRVYSNAIDHWGFYNGEDNSTLIPTIKNVGNIRDNDFLGANRDASFHHGNTYSLTQVSYPTGGYTKYKFEAHQSQQKPYNDGSDNWREAAIDASCGGGLVSNNPYTQDDPAIGGKPAFQLTTFTIPENTTDADLELKASGAFDCGEGPCEAGFAVMKIWVFKGLEDLDFDFEGGQDPDSRFVFYWDFTGQVANGKETVSFKNGEVNISGFEAGTYTAIAFNSLIGTTVIMKSSWLEPVPRPLPQNYEIGGQRIKEIIDYDHNHGQASKRSFDYSEDNGLRLSSGRLFNLPVYHYIENRFTYVKGSMGLGQDLGLTGTVFQTIDGSTSCSILHSQAFSMSDLGRGQGSHIGYSRVVETVVDNEDEANYGKTESLFNNEQLPSANYFAPSNNVDNVNGDLSSQKIYDANDRLLQEEIYEYVKNDISRETPYVLGVKVVPDYPTVFGSLCIWIDENGCESVKMRITQSCEGEDIQFPTIYKNYRYSLHSYWKYLKKKVSRSYDYDEAENPSIIENTTEYFYDNEDHAQLTSQITKNSLGKEIKSVTKYPLDYDTTAEGFDEENRALIIPFLPVGTVLENQTWENGTLISDQITEYKKFGFTFKPYKIHVLESETPVQSLNEGFISSDKKYGKFMHDENLLDVKSIYDFNGNGKLVTFKKGDNSINKTYIWGHYNTLPIAEVINAKPDQVFHTSFEEEISNRSGDYKTGRYSYNGSFTIEGILLTPGDYILTYWEKTGDDWELVTQNVTHTGADITVSGHIDELRVFPKEALMTTYTYRPGIGMTSKANPNNIVSYFEYDGLGRLKHVKDNEGNILKKYEYQYGQDQ